MQSFPDRMLSRAVLIGTSDFEHNDRLPPLPAVRQNLTDLSDALTDPDTGILDWEQCVLIDTPDSPASLMTRLRRAASQAEDVLLVYYAGHGVRHDRRDDLYLTVRQTDPDELDGTAVPFEWIRAAIEHSPARTRLLILDCCYSGMALGSMSSASIDIRDVQVSGTCVITSSPRNKISHSPPGERLTAFSGELISLLTKGPRIAGEPLTVQALYRGLVAAMARRQLPEPKMKAGDLSSELLLRRSPSPPDRLAPQPLAPLPPRDWTPPPFTTKRPAPLVQPPKQWQQKPATTHNAVAGAPASKQTVAHVVAPVALLLLWILLALFLDLFVGSLVGFVFGNRSADLGGVLAGAVMVGLCTPLAWLGMASKRPKGSRLMILGEVRDVLERSLLKVPTWILAILAVFFFSFFISGFFVRTSSSTSSSISDLAVSVALVLWFGQLAAACGYTIIRRNRL